MFNPIVENLCKFTDSAFQMQQDLFKKWVALWPVPATPGTPGIPGSPATAGDPFAIQKKGLEIIGELIQKECETLEAQFKVGLKNIEEAFHLVKAKDPEELRAKAVEIWQKGFDTLRQTSETQARDFRNAAAKWTEIVKKGAA